MSSLNREERQTLRSVQAHLHATMLEAQTLVEQLGTVDVYFHPTNPDPKHNCVTPHKGVAWIRREDLHDAFLGLERLGRLPRLVFQDALFPDAFRQQLHLMGLAPEFEQVVMIYRPMHGPGLPDEIARGRLPHLFDDDITTRLAETRADLAVWARVFRAGYYNTETLHIDAEIVAPLMADVAADKRAYVLAYYQNTPLGAARVCLRPPTAELEAVVTAPLWRGMGLEIALISTAVRAAASRSCAPIFTIAPPEDYTRLYRRLGFIDLSHVLTYWVPDETEAGLLNVNALPSQGEILR
ncbi:MAG: GNAT family N-acetyltransferase [Anaerolineae bacterium]|nr:GNAT family N-acetyltransferase [Anaerolineae bacterium]